MEDKRKKELGIRIPRSGRGGIVAASPKSCAQRESCVGPSPVLPASTGEELAIAEGSPRGRIVTRIGDRVDEVVKEINNNRRKRHISFAVSRQESSPIINDLESKVRREIAENYDDDKSLGDFEIPIEELRTITEKEMEVVAWSLAMDRCVILEDPGAYAYTLIEDLAKALTDPSGFRENDISVASRCAYKVMVILKKMDIELERWKQKYNEITQGKVLKKGKEILDKETQCQLLEATSMKVEEVNPEVGRTVDINEENFNKRMEEVLRKVIKDTGEQLEEGKYPAKAYWDIPKNTITLEKNVTRRREEKNKGEHPGIAREPQDNRRKDRMG